MHGLVILISDDSDFFEYIVPKLNLRKSDELCKFCFNDIPEKMHLIESSLIIVNSENNQQKTLDLFEISGDTPIIVFSYNNDEEFRIKAFQKGMFGYINPEMSDSEIQAQLIPALKLVSSINKTNMYRDLLIQNNLLSKNNEVFLDSNTILDKAIDDINKSRIRATLIAISPGSNEKFLVLPNQIETIILNNIRKNDVLINYAPNKYFLIILNSDVTKTKALWEKISNKLPSGIYAGFVDVAGKKRPQAVNEALSKLHEAINHVKQTPEETSVYIGSNYKFFRNELKKNIEKIISPVFYHIQQKYNDRLYNMKIEQEQNDRFSVLYIKSRHSAGIFKISCPGFSTINVDVSYITKINDITEINLEEYENTSEVKRITLQPEEFERGLLEDLLEQFLSEFISLNKKKEVHNDNT